MSGSSTTTPTSPPSATMSVASVPSTPGLTPTALPQADKALEVIRHHIFYWPDGNIVLIAKKRVAFRILKSQLACHSIVFGDMFSLSMDQAPGGPGLPQTQEVYDGVAMMNVDDDPDDLAMMFTLLWRGPLAPHAVNSLCRLLKVANKYLMEGIREWCIACLKEKVYAVTEAQALGPLKCFGEDPGRPGQVINVARKAEVPELLPLAFYAFATSPWIQKTPGLMFNEIAPQDVQLVLVGTKKLYELWTEFCNECRALTQANKCGSLLGTATCEIGTEKTAGIRQNAMLWGAKDPLKFLLEKGVKDKFTMCGICAAANDSICGTWARKIFSQLSDVFDLPKPASPKAPKRKKGPVVPTTGTNTPATNPFQQTPVAFGATVTPVPFTFGAAQPIFTFSPATPIANTPAPATGSNPA